MGEGAWQAKVDNKKEKEKEMELDPKATAIGVASGVTPKSRRRKKDEHMTEVRRTRGEERNVYQSSNLEDVKPQDPQDLGRLENSN